MITNQKIKIYDKSGGDVDHWARMRDVDEAMNITDKDWYLINTFIQDIGLVKRNLASQQFADKLYERLISNTDSEKTVEALYKIADKYY